VDILEWNADKTHITAEVGSLPLSRLLQVIADNTGWEVFVEPEVKSTASAKFNKLPIGEGLRVLLGDLNYALVPQTNAPSRLFVYQTTMKAATERVYSKIAKLRSDGVKPIPNELIVTVKPGTDIEALARKLGAKVAGRVDGLNTYRLQFDSPEAMQAVLDKLNANPDVAAIDFNYELPRPSPRAISSSGIADLPLHAKAIGADGVITPMLIDTGGDISRYCGLSEFMQPTISAAGETAPAGDGPSHGPSMAAALVRGFAAVRGSAGGKAFRIRIVDVYGVKATTTTFDVANGIYLAVNAGGNPINLSLGTSADSAFLHHVIQQASAQGVIFFAAAGNEPVTAPTFPAAYPEVVAVTAGVHGQIDSYANRGGFVDTMAPGSSLVCYGGQAWNVQGTSAASAFASGVASGAAAMGGPNGQVASVTTNALLSTER